MDADKIQERRSDQATNLEKTCSTERRNIIRRQSSFFSLFLVRLIFPSSHSFNFYLLYYEHVYLCGYIALSQL